MKKANASDVDFLITGLEKTQEIVTNKIEFAHADGAYNSEENQKFCKNNDIELYLHAIQGKKGRFEYKLLENNTLEVFDTLINKNIESYTIISEKGAIKWRIKPDNNYRYISEKELETYNLRVKISNIPTETLQKRNNVEATIFQLGYHYNNAKSRYRGFVKHQMWANMRVLWVNFVRITKFIENIVVFSKYFVRFIFQILNFQIKYLKNRLYNIIDNIFSNNSVLKRV